MIHDDDHQWKLQSAEQMRKLASQQTFDKNLKQLFEENAQYLEELAGSDVHALGGYIKVIILHLLKKDYQPEMEGRSWKKSIRNARGEIDSLFVNMPSLRNKANKQIPSAYKRAKNEASDETDLELKTFPNECPYSIEQILDDNFFGNNQ